MNPPELNYVTQPFQVNVYKIYLEMIRILNQKNKKNNSKAKNLKIRIEELYLFFCEENEIDNDCNDYNRNRLGLIDNTSPLWYTWFTFELVSMKSDLIYSHLNNHYNKSQDPSTFIGTLNSSIRALSNAEIFFFEQKILKITNWINTKAIEFGIDTTQSEKRISPQIVEKMVYVYFEQLLVNELLSKDQIDKLIRANFDFGLPVKKELLQIKIEKAHLNFFISNFFRNYNWNEKKCGINTSKFLRENFAMYKEEAINLEKEYTLRSNLRRTPPKKYLFNL
jgi:hypothetical protein